VQIQFSASAKPKQQKRFALSYAPKTIASFSPHTLALLKISKYGHEQMRQVGCLTKYVIIAHGALLIRNAFFPNARNFKIYGATFINYTRDQDISSNMKNEIGEDPLHSTLRHILTISTVDDLLGIPVRY
jgi:hypothetical protein